MTECQIISEVISLHCFSAVSKRTAIIHNYRRQSASANCRRINGKSSSRRSALPHLHQTSTSLLRQGGSLRHATRLYPVKACSVLFLSASLYVISHLPSLLEKLYSQSASHVQSIGRCYSTSCVAVRFSKKHVTHLTTNIMSSINNQNRPRFRGVKYQPLTSSLGEAAHYASNRVSHIRQRLPTWLLIGVCCLLGLTITLPLISSKTSIATTASTDQVAIRLHPEQHITRRAKTLTFDWRVTQGTRAVDGVEKQVYLVNGKSIGVTVRIQMTISFNHALYRPISRSHD